MNTTLVPEEEAQPLYLYDPTTGEVVSREPSLAAALAKVDELEAMLADIERERRGERARTRQLLARLNDARIGYTRRAEVISIFDEWRTECGHQRARLTNDRFDAVATLLEVKKPEAYPREAFSTAIAGAKFDPFVTRRKNGSEHKHDDLALICRDGKTFEEFIRRAPVKEDEVL